MASVAELIRRGSQDLTGISPTARLDAELLLMAVLKFKNRSALITKAELEVSETDSLTFQRYIERRAKFEPVALILRTKEFWGLAFAVSPATLIPRPDTETLVERAIEIGKTWRREFKVLDLGTGGGCIAIALTYELKKARRNFQCVAVDKSDDALKIARLNAATLIPDAPLQFLKSDWFSAVENGARFDLIVSNPPYIAAGDLEISPELRFEPKSALFSGIDGLDDIRAIVAALPRFLAYDGYFLCEIGHSQAQTLRDEFGEQYSVRMLRDLAGIERVMELRLAR